MGWRRTGHRHVLRNGLRHIGAPYRRHIARSHTAVGSAHHITTLGGGAPRWTPGQCRWSPEDGSSTSALRSGARRGSLSTSQHYVCERTFGTMLSPTAAHDCATPPAAARSSARSRVAARPGCHAPARTRRRHKSRADHGSPRQWQLDPGNCTRTPRCAPQVPLQSLARRCESRIQPAAQFEALKHTAPSARILSRNQAHHARDSRARALRCGPPRGPGLRARPLLLMVSCVAANAAPPLPNRAVCCTAVLHTLQPCCAHGISPRIARRLDMRVSSRTAQLLLVVSQIAFGGHYSRASRRLFARTFHWATAVCAPHREHVSMAAARTPSRDPTSMALRGYRGVQSPLHWCSRALFEGRRLPGRPPIAALAHGERAPPCSCEHGPAQRASTSTVPTRGTACGLAACGGEGRAEVLDAGKCTKSSQ